MVADIILVGLLFIFIWRLCKKTTK